MYTNAPTLLSENLILRGPEARDQEPVIAFLQDEDRAAGFGALPNRGDAWRWFAPECWALGDAWLWLFHDRNQIG
jgi:hypothetical protein